MSTMEFKKHLPSTSDRFVIIHTMDEREAEKSPNGSVWVVRERAWDIEKRQWDIALQRVDGTDSK